MSERTSSSILGFDGWQAVYFSMDFLDSAGEQRVAYELFMINQRLMDVATMEGMVLFEQPTPTVDARQFGRHGGVLGAETNLKQ